MWHFGVHNGCINNTKELSTLFNIKSKPFVDSEIFFWALANLQNSGLSTLDSFKEVIKATSKHSDFAVAYMETEEKALYLIRSHTRPLIIIDANHIGMGRFFCSTPDIFKSAWIEPVLGPIQGASYQNVKPYHLYRISSDGQCKIISKITCEPRLSNKRTILINKSNTKDLI